MMRHLLKKELSELLNKQMLISLLISFLLIMMIGGLMSVSVTEEIGDYGKLRILDRDQTAFTQRVIETLEDKGYEVLQSDEDFSALAEREDWKDAIELPEGLTETLLERHTQAELRSYRRLTTTSVVATAVQSDGDSAVADAIQAVLTEELLTEEQAFLEAPLSTTPYTYANGALVQADATVIVSSLSLFDVILPLILFLLTMLTSQTIISAIAAEKTDKTLETLLSAPVPRSKIIGAKMLAALIVALIYAAVYGIGFMTAMVTTMSGSMEDMDLGAAFTNIGLTHKATVELHLEIPAWGWIGVFVQLALTLGIALTASIILGGLVEDAKGAQNASLPIMILTMVPYMCSMVSDIRGMSTGLRSILYAIPFSHTFIATGCLRFHDMVTFWGGMAYQLLFLAAMGALALKLYTSDLLFVHGFGKKRAEKSEEQ